MPALSTHIRLVDSDDNLSLRPLLALLNHLPHVLLPLQIEASIREPAQVRVIRPGTPPGLHGTSAGARL